jgi:hypothetical protein
MSREKPPRRAESESAFDRIQPPATVRVSSVHGECFPIQPFPSCEEAFSERPGAVKGAPIGAAKQALDGEDRSETIADEGKGHVLGQLLGADKQNRCQVATMILFETRGLQLYWVVRGGIRLLDDSAPSRARSPKVLIDTHPRTLAPGELRLHMPNGSGSVGTHRTFTLSAISTGFRRTGLLSSKPPA